jgi:hypothetical protein
MSLERQTYHVARVLARCEGAVRHCARIAWKTATHHLKVVHVLVVGIRAREVTVGPTPHGWQQELIVNNNQTGKEHGGKSLPRKWQTRVNPVTSLHQSKLYALARSTQHRIEVANRTKRPFAATSSGVAQ